MSLCDSIDIFWKNIRCESDFKEALETSVYSNMDIVPELRNAQILRVKSSIVCTLPDFSIFNNIKKIIFNNCIFPNPYILGNIDKCSNLRVLEIIECNDWINLTDSLELLPKLEALCIYKSTINEIHCDFNKFSKLKKLSISKGYVDPCFMSEVNITSSTLETLTLANCNIKSINFDVNSSNLERINLSNNKIEKIQEDILLMKNLRSLDIDYNLISTLDNLIDSKLSDEVQIYCFTNPLKEIRPELLVNPKIAFSIPYNETTHKDLHSIFIEAKEKAISNVALGIKVKSNKEFIKYMDKNKDKRMIW